MVRALQLLLYGVKRRIHPVGNAYPGRSALRATFSTRFPAAVSSRANDTAVKDIIGFATEHSRLRLYTYTFFLFLFISNIRCIGYVIESLLINRINK